MNALRRPEPAQAGSGQDLTLIRTWSDTGPTSGLT